MEDKRQPRVWNKRDPDCPKDAVYVGRPTKWGNPFVLGKDGSRTQDIEKYRCYILDHVYTSDLFMADINELRGKDLVCWCAPESCHADILLKMANL